MKAMIMAAGLGTRLRPWTLSHPKALVPVECVPALERLILKLKGHGFDYIVVNVHHFADQVKSFLHRHDFGIHIEISDESDRLLDTGGALVKATSLLSAVPGPVLVHNVDILSNADMGELMDAHMLAGNDVTLMTSMRDSSRKLLFEPDGRLAGWHKVGTEEYKPGGFKPEFDMTEEAFSGIYVVGERALRDMARYSAELGDEKFPVMDYFLSIHPDGTQRADSTPGDIVIRHYMNESLRLLDIGKPEALARASGFIED